MFSRSYLKIIMDHCLLFTQFESNYVFEIYVIQQPLNYQSCIEILAHQKYIRRKKVKNKRKEKNSSI